MTCINCGHLHLTDTVDDPENVCTDKWCMCFDFQPATPEQPVKPSYSANLESLHTTKDRVQYVLDNYPEQRDTKSDDFIEKFRDVFPDAKAAAESITRMRRHWAEDFPDIYGPTREHPERKNQYDAHFEIAITKNA